METGELTQKQQRTEVIKSVVGRVFKDSIKGLKVHDTLVLTVYNTLIKLYVDDVDNVTISAPTGSGKSIISYLLGFCCMEINKKLNIGFEDVDDSDAESDKFYILTSSIMLQEQIDEDISKFQMANIEILKGANNYPCTNEVAMARTPNISVPWANRECAGLSKKKISENFQCYNTCNYYQKLHDCSSVNVSVLNYSYFMKAVPNTYFPKGFLTICDEAHLLPEIISDTFSVDITKSDWSFVDDMIFNHLPSKYLSDAEAAQFKKLSKIFTTRITKNNVGSIKKWLWSFVNELQKLDEYCNDINDQTLVMFPILKFKIDKFKKLFQKYKNYSFIVNRIKDENLFIDMLSNEDFGHDFNVRDLDEKNIINDVMSKLTHKTVFLSATYGNMKTFNNFFPYGPDNFKNYKLASTFDFSKSPIILKEAGWLNYANFDNNIDKVIIETLKVVNQHKNENGIIHTGTFKIAEMLKEYIKNLPPIFKSRFLFYSNSIEKNAIIDRLHNACIMGKNGYILVGPSLYEGLDLKDDLGRFNIIIKAPYGALDAYTKEKMKRYPDWYRNSCLQKIEQAIGRTNRHKDDYSKVYLMDNSLKKLVLMLDPIIRNRLIYG